MDRTLPPGAHAGFARRVAMTSGKHAVTAPASFWHPGSNELLCLEYFTVAPTLLTLKDEWRRSLMNETGRQFARIARTR